MYRFGHNIAGLIFAILGIYFVYQDAGHMSAHGNTLFGISEMTLMWFTMAVVHFCLHDCKCNSCKDKK